MGLVKGSVADGLSEALVRGKAAMPLGAMLSGTAAKREHARLLGARRYLIDDEVARAAGGLSVSHPQVLERLLPGIRLPAPTIWLEWSTEAAAEGTGFAPRREDGFVAARAGAPVMIGALLSTIGGSPSRFTIDLIVRDNMQDWRGEVVEGFVPLPFGFVCDTERPLPSEAFSDEIGLAERICKSHAVLSNKLLGPAMIGSLAGMIAGDPEFLDAMPDAGGYREHRFRYDAEGRLMLSEAAMERLDLTREELDGRFAAARRVCAHASHRFAYHGVEIWRRIQGLRSPEVRDILGNIAEFTNMYSSTFGFLIAVLAMMANPEIVDGSDTQRASGRRSVGARSLPYLENRVLKLRLRRKAAIAAAVRSVVNRQPSRLHDVDGHWRTSHRRGDPACDHAWLAVNPNRQTCSLCDGLRWWVAAYERGDPSRGSVDRDRRITLE